METKEEEMSREQENQVEFLLLPTRGHEVQNCQNVMVLTSYKHKIKRKEILFQKNMPET